MKKGEIFGIVGESGCGKSLTSKSIMRILNEKFISKGTVCYFGKNLLEISEKEMCSMRGKNISIVFQDALAALNPLKKIGKQVEECLKIHRKMPKEERIKKVYETLRECGIREPEEICRKYPHELSGGQRQRILIAMAVICNPSLIICDECTTALDLRTQLTIIKLLKKLNKEKNMSIIFVSHDIALIEAICDRIMVMYAGRSVEIIEALLKMLFILIQELYTVCFLVWIIKIECFLMYQEQLFPQIKGKGKGVTLEIGVNISQNAERMI